MPDLNHNYKWTLEFKVGLMTMGALLTLMVSLLFINNFQFGTGGRVVTVSFNFLGDLKTNAPVEYAGGINVGTVKDIRVGDKKALVDLLITNKDLKLRADSQIALYSATLGFPLCPDRGRSGQWTGTWEGRNTGREGFEQPGPDLQRVGGCYGSLRKNDGGPRGEGKFPSFFRQYE